MGSGHHCVQRFQKNVQKTVRNPFRLSLAHTARFLSLATKILSSVVSEEKEFLAGLILKIVVSDKSR